MTFTFCIDTYCSHSQEVNKIIVSTSCNIFQLFPTSKNVMVMSTFLYRQYYFTGGIEISYQTIRTLVIVCITSFLAYQQLF